MQVIKEELRESLEPKFLSQAQSLGVKLRVGQMNKTEHEGVIRDIGRYEINIEQSGKIITILKQEISFLSAPHSIITSIIQPTDAGSDHSENRKAPIDVSPAKPNIQQEFLEKAIRDQQTVTVFLMNGQRVKANIEAYDNFTILVTEGGRQHLYYKHSITTINR